MAARGVWAEISLGDTYRWVTEDEYVDGVREFDSEFVKSFGIYVYTGFWKSKSQQCCKDMMVIEVSGAKSKSEIVPVVENSDFNGSFDISILTDKELQDKVMPPISTSSKWKEDYNWTDGREPVDISGVPADCSAFGYLGWNPYSYNYKSENDWDCDWPIDLWPNGETKSDRYWIVVSVKSAANMRWYGMDSFRIRLKNQNLITDNLYIMYSPDDAWPYWGNGKYKNFRRGFEIANTRMIMSPYLWELWSVSYNAPLHAYWLDCEDEGKLNLKFPEAGTLYVSSTSIDNLENQIGKVVGVDSDSIKLTCIREDWSLDEWFDWSDVDRREYFFENCMSFDYPQVGLLEIKVDSARTISFETDYIEFNRMQFYPANKKSVAIEASYVSIANENKYPLRNGEIGVYLQGYVEGMGVYKVGETVSLKAIPGAGEEFSHWELMYGNFPDGIDTTKATLNFKVTDACAGSADERKQMVVKAVWCTMQKPIVSFDANYGPLVPGAAVELNLGLVGYTAKKLPSGLKLDKKTGIVKGKAKKPGEYQVTFTKKGAETLTAKFIVGPMPSITITMEGDIEKCKVTGASKQGKGYLVGKKVSLSAKGPKGTAFTGWFKDGEPWPNETEYLESKLKYVMTEENLSLVARFEKEKMSVLCDGLSALAVGEEVSIPIAIETQSGVKSVTGSKLPTGLKVKKDKATGEWFVTGKPKKVGAWNSVIKVTAKSGAVEQLPVAVTVEDKGEVDLPSANHHLGSL